MLQISARDSIVRSRSDQCRCRTFRVVIRTGQVGVPGGAEQLVGIIEMRDAYSLLSSSGSPTTCRNKSLTHPCLHCLSIVIRDNG